MTEAEWLEETEPGPLADYSCSELRANKTKSGRRKLRLFSCACCRQVWHLFEEYPECARVVEHVESTVDTGWSQRDWAVVVRELNETVSNWQVVVAARSLPWANAFEACINVSGVLANAIESAKPDRQARASAEQEEDESAINDPRVEQARLFRCIFGNPFRPATFDPSWRTATVLDLARGIYEERTFDRLPILADALQEAGCENEEMLAHCRGAGPHARGCWAVDLVLGKA